MNEPTPTRFYQRMTDAGNGDVGLGADALAAELTEKLGRPIEKKAVQRYGRQRNPPREWLTALGLDGPAPSLGERPDSDGGSSSGRQTEVPPEQPKGAAFVPTQTPAALSSIAKERITSLHVFAGAAIASGVDPRGFEADRGVGGGIGALWKDKAPELADAWVAWAEEGNKFARAFVDLMGRGGHGGTLVLGYAMLLGGTAYIMGAMPDNEATRFAYGRYSRYRTVSVEPEPEPEPEPAAGSGADNGARAGFDAAADSLGAATGPARG